MNHWKFLGYQDTRSVSDRPKWWCDKWQPGNDEILKKICKVIRWGNLPQIQLMVLLGGEFLMLSYVFRCGFPVSIIRSGILAKQFNIECRFSTLTNPPNKKKALAFKSSEDSGRRRREQRNWVNSRLIFSSWTAWLCCLPMVHKLQSKHISKETSDRDRLTQGDSSSPFFGYKKSSFLGGFSCRASQPNSTKALSTEFTSSPCQLWNLIILINKIPKTNEDISQ